MLVQYKPNEILVLPEELPLNIPIRNSKCPAESNANMQLLYAVLLYAVYIKWGGIK